MFGYCLRLALVFGSFLLVAADTTAHDSWISRGGHRNGAGAAAKATASSFPA
jgi:hypothetical protein